MNQAYQVYQAHQSQMEQEEQTQAERGLSLFPAIVIAEAGEHGSQKGPAFRSQLDGKVGFVRNWRAYVLKKEHVVMVEIEPSSQKNYAEYSYWIGRIVERV